MRSDDDSRRRRIILDLMCHFEMRFADHGGREAFAKTYGDELTELETFVHDELLRIDDDAIRVTQPGRLFVRNICMTFDAYLKQADRSRPMFSRTV